MKDFRKVYQAYFISFIIVAIMFGLSLVFVKDSQGITLQLIHTPIVFTYFVYKPSKKNLLLAIAVDGTIRLFLAMFKLNQLQCDGRLVLAYTVVLLVIYLVLSSKKRC